MLKSVDKFLSSVRRHQRRFAGPEAGVHPLLLEAGGQHAGRMRLRALRKPHEQQHLPLRANATSAPFLLFFSTLDFHLFTFVKRLFAATAEEQIRFDERLGLGCRHDASLRVSYGYTNLQLVFAKVN